MFLWPRILSFVVMELAMVSLSLSQKQLESSREPVAAKINSCTCLFFYVYQTNREDCCEAFFAFSIPLILETFSFWTKTTWNSISTAFHWMYSMYIHLQFYIPQPKSKSDCNALYLASITIIYNDETVTAFAIPSGLKCQRWITNLTGILLYHVIEKAIVYLL